MIEKLAFTEKVIGKKEDSIIIQQDPQPLFVIQDKLNEVINAVNIITARLNVLSDHSSRYMDTICKRINQLHNAVKGKAFIDAPTIIEKAPDIDWSRLPTYIVNRLRLDKITTEDKLRRMTKRDILQTPGFGNKAVYFINKYFEEQKK